MGSGTYGLAPLNLLVVVLVLGLVWWLPWREVRRKLVVQAAAPKEPRPLKPKTGVDCPSPSIDSLLIRQPGPPRSAHRLAPVSVS